MPLNIHLKWFLHLILTITLDKFSRSKWFHRICVAAVTCEALCSLRRVVEDVAYVTRDGNLLTMRHQRIMSRIHYISSLYFWNVTGKTLNVHLNSSNIKS